MEAVATDNVQLIATAAAIEEGRDHSQIYAEDTKPEALEMSRCAPSQLGTGNS